MADEARAAFGAPEPPRRPPSRAGYWAGGVLIVLGVAGAVLWAVVGFMRFGDAVDDLARVPIPAGGEVALGAGHRAIYYEAADAQERSPALRIAIRSVDGPAARIGGHSGSVSYSVGDHTGQSVASVDVPRDGRYVVTVSAQDAALPADAGLAIGKGLGNRIVRIIVGAILLVVLGALAGTALIVVTSARRRRARPA